ncbi:hypothetical protein AB0O91_21020 [Kitasatospora sp. NPDC089797]|uniref:phage tail tube protein n=1 Tax=Kitasatospora sp. NPDC089797 TaxID=3155298 RepID=UPI003421D269
MADLISDGNTKVAWASSVANVQSPTAAELTAALDWTTRITPDGLKTDPTTADVDTSSLASTFETKVPGRKSYSAEITCKRGSTPADDQPYATLTYGTTGYLIVRRGLPFQTAFGTGQQVEVYPVACGEPQNIAPTANEILKFQVPLKVISDPATRAIVA